MSSYLYDANGNATTDGRSGNIITYNRLNLPSGVAALNLSYVYDAAGNKLKKKSGAKVTDYISGIQYTDGALELIQTEAGVARKNGSVYSYEYNLSDHLGNVRYTFYKNPVGGSIERLQSDEYYPFGLRKLVQEGTNKYLYNGKELQQELGQYDYGARFYDPVIGRWNTIDPLAELGRRHSPYNYALNNPIRNIDPDGMMTTDADGNQHSDSAEEAQAMFRQLQGQFGNSESSTQGDGPGDKGKKNGKHKKDTEKNNADDKRREKPSYTPAPSTLEAFPKAGKGRYNPESDRKRWVLPDGTILEWDYENGQVEKYDKTGKKHQGQFDPETGKQTGDAKKDRTTPKMQEIEPDAQQIINTRRQVFPVFNPPVGGVNPTTSGAMTTTIIILMILLSPVGI